MEEATFNHADTKNHIINDYENDVKPSYDFLKSDILARVELLEKEIAEFRRKPKMVDFSCQTERNHYESYGESTSSLNNTSTQTYLENTSAALSNINGRLEELKYYLNYKIEKLQYSLKHHSADPVATIHKDRPESITTSATSPDVNHNSPKVKYTPYSMVKTSDAIKYRSVDTSSGKPLDIRASLEKSKQLFQQEIEASLQHGRMQQQSSPYAAVDKKASAFSQYISQSSSMMSSSKSVYNVYNNNTQYYDGRRSMYYEKHPFQISREEYARELVDEMFAYDELAHANVTGVKGKRLLDQKKIQMIKDSVLSRYPLQPSESEEIAWKLICDKINTKCRGVTRTLMKRKASNPINGYSLDYYPVRKKSTEREYFNDMPPSMASSMYQNTQIVSPIGAWGHGNERDIDKARESIFISDSSKLFCAPSEKREIVVSDSEITNVIGSETNTDKDKDINNHVEGESSPLEEIIVASPLARSYENNSTSNSLDDQSEDRHNISFTQSNDDNSSINGDDNSCDTNSVDVTNEDEKIYSGDNELNVTSVSSDVTKTEEEGFKPYSSYKSDVDNYHPIQAQSSFTFSSGVTQPTTTSGVNTLTDETRGLFDANPEGRRFCRQECARGSRKELTRNLIDSMFSRATLAHSNVTGARGKSMLEPAKIAKVREMVFSQYPANSKEEEEVIWRKLTTKINTKCRGVKRFLKRKNLLDGTAVGTKERIMCEMEGNLEKNAMRNNLNHPTSKSLEKVTDYYVSMVGRNSYGIERSVDQTIMKNSLPVDRYSINRDKQSESQYVTMVANPPSYNAHHGRDIDSSLEKGSLRSVLGLVTTSPKNIINSPYAHLPRGISSPISHDRILRDIDNNVDKPPYINSLTRNISTPEKINTYPYRMSGPSISESDIKKEPKPYPSIFSHKRNLLTSSTDKDIERITVSDDNIPISSGHFIEHVSMSRDNDIHRSSFGYQRHLSTPEKSDTTRSIFGHESRERVASDGDSESTHRKPLTFERNAPVSVDVTTSHEYRGSRDYDSIDTNSSGEPTMVSRSYSM